ncbi:MAG: 50S ribosomal protein L6 [Deltaproteobacteria bacterium]|nr:50S ribosomal protein L6 [Deltaproteobacteria bacterium]
MSRVGKYPISIPSDVKIQLQGNSLQVEGPKGKLSRALPPLVQLDVSDTAIQVRRKDDSREARSMHGLTQRLVLNMVRGVHAGFTQVLEVIGVGYRAEPRGSALYLNLGYSHPIMFQLPPEVTAKVDRQTVITLESRDRQILGETAAMIRKLRPPEPYKGKGIKYTEEVLRRKAGKAAGAAGGG